MAEYTMELRKIVESEYLDIGMKDYPIFDEAYRDKLNQKIFDHYWFHEIEYYTPERFVFEINRKMREIMPYYNQLYESELLSIDPLLTFSRDMIMVKDSSKDIDTSKDSEKLMSNETGRVDSLTLNNDTSTDSTKTSDEVTDVTNTNTSTTIDDIDESNSEKLIESDTPTEQLLTGDISTNVYATKANVNESSMSNDSSRIVTEELAENRDGTKTDVTSETVENDQQMDSTSDTSVAGNESQNEIGTINEVENETETRNVSGFEESMSQLLIDYRTTFLNIDMMIIEDLNTLFFKVRGSWKGGYC